MSSIVIGFGGTGAKMVHSFVMLAASGAIKLAQPVKILLVDQDRSNGNTQRTAEAVELYRKIHELMEAADDSVRPFNVKLETYSDVIWQPLRQAEATMAKVFRHTEIRSQQDVSSLLLETLYSHQELKETTLGEGFRGHPNIGAPVFAETLDFNAEPWRTVLQDIHQGIHAAGSTVVLCGSIFGGTGAAGIPSTCKILRQHIEKEGRAADRAQLVLNLAMPYFTIREQQGAGLQADGKYFAVNSKAALQYYHDARYLEFCDALYLLGDVDPAPIEIASVGGKTQRNPAHPVELFAACNIVHALSNKDAGRKLVLTQRTDAGSYQWDDLPVNDDAGIYAPGYIRARVGAFARTCYALQSLKTALDHYKATKNLGDLAWLLNYFPDTAQMNATQIEEVERMAQLFLEWAGEMQLSAASIQSKKVVYGAKWFKAETIVEGRAPDMTVRLKKLDPDSISTILQPEQAEERYTFRMLHHDLQRKPAGSMRPGLPGLVRDLYGECGKKLTGFHSNLAPAAGGSHA